MWNEWSVARKLTMVIQPVEVDGGLLIGTAVFQYALLTESSRLTVIFLALGDYVATILRPKI